MRKILAFCLVLFVFLCIDCSPGSSVYRKISMIEFDSFDMEDTREINRLRRKDNLPLLRYSVELIDFAQQEAERIANQSHFDALRFFKLNQTEPKKLFAYLIKYTGQLMVDSIYLGYYTCYDNFLNVEYEPAYSFDENCSPIDENKFYEYGVGRYPDTDRNLFVVRVFLFKDK